VSFMWIDTINLPLPCPTALSICHNPITFSILQLATFCGVALLGIFILVFSGIWVSLTHGQNGEYLSYAAESNYILEKGGIPGILQSIGATDYPGLPLLLSVIRLVPGFKLFDSIFILVLVNILLYSTLLYILLRSLLKEPFLAAFGSLILIMGSREVSIVLPELHPRGFGLVLLVAMLVLLFSKYQQAGEGRSVPITQLSIILFAALLMTHLVTAMVFVIILICMFLVGRFSKQHLVDLLHIALFLVILLAWQIYFAFYTNSVLLNTAMDSLRQLFGGVLISQYFSHMVGSYLGAEGTPVWVNIVRYFWLVLTMAFGSIIGLINLFKIRNFSPMDKKLLGGLVGLGLFVSLTLVTSGLNEGMRILYYLPFFTVPILLGFIYKQRSLIKGYSLTILVVMLLTVSVPSFLVNNDRVGVAAVYPQEIYTSKFLSGIYGNGKGLKVVGDVLQRRQILLDMPEAQTESFFAFAQSYFEGQDPVERTWAELEMLITHFEEPRESYFQIQNSLFLFSPQLSTSFMFMMRFDPNTDPRWQELQDRLKQQVLIYNNGFTEVYDAKITQ
jgi:hypothetical protein